MPSTQAVKKSDIKTRYIYGWLIKIRLTSTISSKPFLDCHVGIDKFEKKEIYILGEMLDNIEIIHDDVW